MAWSKRKLMLGVVVLAALYELYWNLRIKIKKLPPGPSRLCRFYFMLKMFLLKRRLDDWEISREINNYYGNPGIRYSSLFGIEIVNIYSSSLAKQLLNNKNVLDRPIFGDHKNKLNIESTSDGTSPFANINGKEWEKRRKLSQTILFRMCTSQFVGKILDESLTNVVMPHLDKLCNNNKLWYPMSLMKYTAFNTIFYANYGQHISYDNPLYHSLVDVITETFQLFRIGIALSLFPKWVLFFFKLFPNSSYYKIMDLIKRRDAVYDEFKVYFDQNKHKKDENNTYYVDYIANELTESQVLADTGSLFAAGTDTTSSTLNFIIIFAAKYQGIQRKIRNELIDCWKENNNDIEVRDDNIKRFHMNWINKLTYFRAFIYEALRLSSITKVGLPHMTSKDIWIDINNAKYCIPKGFMVVYVTELIHKETEDRENWVNSSNNICLENWINRETNKFEINDSFLTFGTGRRDCVGRNLALKNIYIIIGYLLLNYSFSFQDNDKDIDIKTVWNGVNNIDPPIGVIVKHLDTN